MVNLDSVRNRTYSGPNQMELEFLVAELDSLLILSQINFKRDIAAKHVQIKQLLASADRETKSRPTKKKQQNPQKKRKA